MTHRITFLPQTQTTEAPDDCSIMDVARQFGILIDSTCGGQGTCGKCEVTLTPGGRQLACRTVVDRDFVVEVPALPGIPSEVPGRSAENADLGLALDIGTTTITAAILDLHTGEMRAAGSIRNRQASYGADVIDRISYTMTHADGLTLLRRAVATSINDLVGRLIGPHAENVREAIAVGNTTMLHILLGVSPESIGVAPFTPSLPGPVTMTAAEIGLQLHPEASVSTLPHIGAYVGADTVAGILATNLLRLDDGKPRLFLDIGTNVEIVLRAGERTVGTAAPAGPAFEGAHIQCGMAACEGAIEGVQIADEVHLRIIGDRWPPRGICGSGLISAVVALRKCGLLNESGRLHAAFVLSSAHEIILTQKDIRALQYAKAAVASGTRLLLAHFGLAPCDIEEVLLAGAFGSSIDPESARTIGLVPPVCLERIVPVGNAALAGARIALLSGEEREAANQIPNRVEYLELSAQPEFNDLFLEALAFPSTAPGPEGTPSRLGK
jgi:uncharacterized 2Fe-2S/4Fe-4S cluster protein (DUF4445 family)